LGCTIHLGNQQTPLTNEIITPDGIQITTASSDRMHGVSKGHLPFNLPTAKSKVCHRIPNVHVPLFSIGQACDANCTTIFNANRMTLVKNEDINIKYNAKPILEGHRAANGLWMIPVPKSKHQQTSTT